MCDKHVTVTVTMSSEMAQASRIVAAIEGKSRSELIRDALSEKVARQILEEPSRAEEASSGES